MPRDQLSWDTGGRQEWCLEGGDLTSETAETMAPGLQPVPHTRALPLLPATPRGPSAPPSCRQWGRACVWRPHRPKGGHLYARVELRLGKSLLTLRKQEKGKRFVFECKVSMPLSLSLGLGGAGSPTWWDPALGQAMAGRGRVSSPSHAGLASVPAHTLHQGPAASCHAHGAVSPGPWLRPAPLFSLTPWPLALVRAAEAF